MVRVILFTSNHSQEEICQPLAFVDLCWVLLFSVGIRKKPLMCIVNNGLDGIQALYAQYGPLDQETIPANE